MIDKISDQRMCNLGSLLYKSILDFLILQSQFYHILYFITAVFKSVETKGNKKFR